jgi:hypothetical protein
MRISSTKGSEVPSPSEIGPDVNGPDRPIVRVIWHGTYGSTYQRYDRRGQGHPLPPGGHSIFSRPLTCPSCREALELHQPEEDSPDRLIGTCSHCQTRALLEIEDGGRITLSVLPRQPDSTGHHGGRSGSEARNPRLGDQRRSPRVEESRGENARIVNVDDQFSRCRKVSMIRHFIWSVAILGLTSLGYGRAEAGFVLTANSAGSQSSTVTFDSFTTGKYTVLATTVGPLSSPGPGASITE